MSEIKGLFTLVHDRCEGSGDGRPCAECDGRCEYPYEVQGAEGKTVLSFAPKVTEQQAQAVLAALNATAPDAGDVEASEPEYIVSTVSYQDLMGQYNDIVDELHAAEYREAQLRGALEFVLAKAQNARSVYEGGQHVGIAGMDHKMARDLYDAADATLATPASDAAQKVQALERYWTAKKHYDDANLALETRPEDASREEKRRLALNVGAAFQELAQAESALRALDGKDGETEQPARPVHPVTPPAVPIPCHCEEPVRAVDERGLTYCAFCQGFLGEALRALDGKAVEPR